VVIVSCEWTIVHIQFYSGEKNKYFILNIEKLRKFISNFLLSGFIILLLFLENKKNTICNFVFIFY